MSGADRPVAEFFNRRVDRYDAAYGAPGPGRHVLGARMAAALELIGEGPGDSLDVGMGTGRLCVELAARGWTVSGIDISGAMVARARARLPAAADRFRCGSLQQLPFADASYDVVSATGVIEYVHDLAAALGELARVLRPLGLAVLSISNPDTPYRFSRQIWHPIARRARRASGARVYETPGGIGAVAPTEFTIALNAAGLDVEQFRYLGALVVPTPVDSLMPAVAERCARVAERIDWTRRTLATQLVFAATRRAER